MVRWPHSDTEGAPQGLGALKDEHAPTRFRAFPVRDYDLAATLNSGQVFRWRRHAQGWSSVVGGHWVYLREEGSSILAEAAEPTTDWSWLTDYLQLDQVLSEVLGTFPDDEPMRAAVAACRGLRLLRQDPWECLASFILSSTKQIVQIRQIVAQLCECYGEPVATPAGDEGGRAFPAPVRLAAASETELRACKMGFRAPYLLEAAHRIASGQFDLARPGELPLEGARTELLSLPGVGPKIADCVLLFAYGFPKAFPVDVWVLRALRELYFPRRRATLRRVQQFASAHFGPHAGYAQQYLFHYIRTRGQGPNV